MSTPAQELSCDVIATSFVKQYYTTMHEDPSSIHRSTLRLGDCALATAPWRLRLDCCALTAAPWRLRLDCCALTAAPTVAPQQLTDHQDTSPLTLITPSLTPPQEPQRLFFCGELLPSRSFGFFRVWQLGRSLREPLSPPPPLGTTRRTRSSST